MQPPLDNPWLIQSKLLRLIHGARHDSTADFITLRLTTWFGDEAADATPNVLANIRRLCGIAPDRIAFSVFRGICNGWCTSRRFQQTTIACRLCGAEARDDFRHYIDCGAVHAFVDTHVAHRFWPGGAEASTRRAMLADPIGSEGLLVPAAILDVVLQAVNAARAGSQYANGWQLLLGGWRALIRASPEIQKAWFSIRFPAAEIPTVVFTDSV